MDKTMATRPSFKTSVCSRVTSHMSPITQHHHNTTNTTTTSHTDDELIDDEDEDVDPDDLSNPLYQINLKVNLIPHIYKISLEENNL